MVLTVGGDPSADDDQIVACEIYISGQLLDSQYRRGKNATVTCSYSSWRQEPFNGARSTCRGLANTATISPSLCPDKIEAVVFHNT